MQFENFNITDEYTNLSYLNNNNNNYNNNISNFNIGKVINNNNNNANSLISSFQVAAEQQFNKQSQKKSEIDFKVKYKTEKCKFWEINKTCKFGEGVILSLFMNIIIN